MCKRVAFPALFRPSRLIFPDFLEGPKKIRNSSRQFSGDGGGSYQTSQERVSQSQKRVSECQEANPLKTF